MGLLKNEKGLAKFEYDFAVDGGATGVIALREKISKLEADMLVTDIYVYVEKALDSAADGHSVTLGDGNDPDGYMADIASLAGSDNAAIRVGEVAGALVWDDTNDHKILHRVGSNSALELTVAGEALTAGKLQVFVEYLAPKAE